MKIVEDEICQGLVAHLDVEALRRTGKSRSSTPLHSCGGKKTFMVLGVSPKSGDVLALPLFSVGDGRPKYEPLERALKSYLGNDTQVRRHWVDTNSYYHNTQVWLIPMREFCDASEIEMSKAGQRMYYAKDREYIFAEIVNQLPIGQRHKSKWGNVVGVAGYNYSPSGYYKHASIYEPTRSTN